MIFTPRRTLSPKDFSAWAQFTSDLIETGLPADEAFLISARELSNRPRRLVEAAAAALRRGTTLGEGISSLQKRLSAETTRLIESARGRGEEAAALRLIAQDLYWSLRVLGPALLYPVIVLSIAFVVASVILIFVIPAFKEVFMSFGADLPALTLFVMHLSDWFVQYWYFFPVPIAAWYFRNRAFDGFPRATAVIERAFFRLPFLGKLVQRALTARLANWLSFAAVNEIPASLALAAAHAQSRPGVWRRLLKKLLAASSENASLTAALRASPALSPSFAELWRSIETASVDKEMSMRATRLYALQSAALLGEFESRFTIVVQVSVALIIALFVIAMYLPIFGLGRM